MFGFKNLPADLPNLDLGFLSMYSNIVTQPKY